MIIEFFELIDSYCCEWIKWQWIFINENDCLEPRGKMNRTMTKRALDDKNSPFMLNKNEFN